MIIQRQHDVTSIPELNGRLVQDFWGVLSETIDRYLFFYIEVEGEWYRFFIQHGVLFWATAAPDPEDDLGNDGEYTNIFELRKLSSQTVKSIAMNGGTLTFEFDEGSIVLNEVDSSGTIALA